MKAKSGLFFEQHLYQCAFAWPIGSNSQCGGKDVDGIGTSNFFEVFIQSPKMYLRGEGDSVKAAETVAWSKWENYLACTEHNFERKFSKSTIGICSHCKASISDFFESGECCVECGLVGVNQYISGEAVCYKHYMEKAKKLVKESKDDYEIAMHSKIIFRFEVLESLNAFNEVKKEHEYHDIFMKNYSDFFEYSMDVIKIYKEAINANHSLHFVDLLEYIETNETLYKNLFTIYLVLNKGFNSSLSIQDLENPIKNYIKEKLNQ